MPNSDRETWIRKSTLSAQTGTWYVRLLLNYGKGLLAPTTDESSAMVTFFVEPPYGSQTRPPGCGFYCTVHNSWDTSFSATGYSEGQDGATRFSLKYEWQ